MTGFLTEAGTFITRVVFEFYILLVMLRFILQSARADFYNPLSQFIVKLTTPPLKPLRRIIPGVAGIDIASVALLILLKLIELSIIFLLAGNFPSISAFLIVALHDLLQMALYIYIVAIIVIAIASWFQPAGYNPVLSLLGQLTEPLVRPIRRRMPAASGLDFSPLIVLLLLNLALMALKHLTGALLKLVAG